MKHQLHALATPRSIFSRDRLWQSWLDVEAALAATQAELGIIPGWAGEAITKHANLNSLDRRALEAAVRATRAPVLALARVLSEACGEAGAYVHWGATTQNIMQTGRTLLVRQVHRAILGHLAEAIEKLAGLARDHAATPMAGRTNRRHALPMSFGFKVAGWIEELVRADARLAEAEPRVFSLAFGGALGPMHSFREEGRELTRRLAERLGLRELLVPNRVSADTSIEYVVELSMMAMSIGRIAEELYLLMTEEISEIAEVQDDEVVGSSTMPHKVNPKQVIGVSAKAALLRSKAVAAMDAGRPSYEGDAAANRLLSLVMEEACPLAWELSVDFAELLHVITVKPERMAANLSATGDVIASENLMMQLAAIIGRQKAHDVIHHVIADAVANGRPVRAALHAEPSIAGAFDVATIDRFLTPENYMGRSAEIAREASDLGLETARVIRTRLGRS